ncbi:hypothetical protein RR48_14209 [Papilio machaon]|uniref:Uncharacterized protein n=1 Tax=Papilio machaon TaxID=76193 RepID=A0A194QNC0_PAPMA|nr:hypothetical protein RR48_14209 [Papilio machaon]
MPHSIFAGNLANELEWQASTAHAINSQLAISRLSVEMLQDYISRDEHPGQKQRKGFFRSFWKKSRHYSLEHP